MTQVLIQMHTITQNDARHVLGVMRHEGGTQPGGFTEKLIEAILVADTGNQERLSMGFAGLVAACQVYKHLNGGVKLLQRIASGKPV